MGADQNEVGLRYAHYPKADEAPGPGLCPGPEFKPTPTARMPLVLRPTLDITERGPDTPPNPAPFSPVILSIATPINAEQRGELFPTSGLYRVIALHNPRCCQHEEYRQHCQDTQKPRALFGIHQ